MPLTPHDIAKMLDHSTLQPYLIEEGIRKGCELALRYDCASVCARPCNVPILREMLASSNVKVCTIEDLKLMRSSVYPHMQVKGSGGIRDLDTVLSARVVGASRCGVSATEKIMQEAEARYAEGTLKEVDVLTEMGGGY